MIDRTEIEAVAGRFGVPDTQIIRDHLISHVLAAIADWPDSNRVTFFGGTALCRTWLPDLRLSEDIDLLIDSPSDGEGLRGHVTRQLRREFPNLAWSRLGSSTRSRPGPWPPTTPRSRCSSRNGATGGGRFRS